MPVTTVDAVITEVAAVFIEADACGTGMAAVTTVPGGGATDMSGGDGTATAVPLSEVFATGIS
jgi:hypothetical protein